LAQDAVFTVNRAFESAGAMMVLCDDLEESVTPYVFFGSCNFGDNQARDSAGDLAFPGVREAVIDECTFVCCHADGQGGAVGVLDGSVLMFRPRFVNTPPVVEGAAPTTVFGQ
jgi:hypothetical protein